MIVRDVLANVSEKAERQLDRMEKHLPQVAEPQMPFAEYLPQAMAYAKTNEQFARKLARALYEAGRQGR